jgi:hypothetical protein
MPTITNINEDGSLRDFYESQVATWDLGTRGIRDGSHPTETYSPSGSGCERKWLCSWEHRFDVISHMIGAVRLYYVGLTPKLSRTKPQSHPEFPQWVCVKAVVTGHKFLEDTGDAGNLLPKWDAAELSATYEQVPFRILNDVEIDDNEINRYVTEPGHVGAEVTSSTSYLNLPGGTSQYLDVDNKGPLDTPAGVHGVKIPYNVGFPEGEGKFSAIWRRIPEEAFKPGMPLFDRLHGDPVNGIPPWIGTTNSTPLFGRPIGTCLLEGVEPKLLPDPTGADFGYSWDIKYNWIYKPQTHYRLFYFNTNPAAALANGYKVVGRIGLTYTLPEAMGDTDSFFPLRDHAVGLFKVS